MLRELFSHDSSNRFVGSQQLSEAKKCDYWTANFRKGFHILMKWQYQTEMIVRIFLTRNNDLDWTRRRHNSHQKGSKWKMYGSCSKGVWSQRWWPKVACLDSLLNLLQFFFVVPQGLRFLNIIQGLWKNSWSSYEKKFSESSSTYRKDLCKTFEFFVVYNNTGPSIEYLKRL